MRSTVFAAAAVLALALALSGCAEASSGTTAAAPPSSHSAAPDATAPIQFHDMWVKATDTPMTAVFGELKNTTGEDLHVVGVTSDVAGVAELHETVNKDGQMTMQEMSDGFVIEANGAFSLEPGGNHLMLMDLADPIEPGQDVTVTLQLQGGENLEFTATARSFAGAQEEYGVHGDDGH